MRPSCGYWCLVFSRHRMNSQSPVVAEGVLQEAVTMHHYVSREQSEHVREDGHIVQLLLKVGK